MRIFLFFAIVVGNYCSIFAQKVTLHGNVWDTLTGEQLIGANIYDTTNSTGTVTNNFGFYTTYIKKDKVYTLRCSYIGYHPILVTFKAINDTTINFKLTADNTIEEVLVHSTSAKRIEELAEISKIEIPISQIKTLPTITGEPDILKAYQLMPGVQSGSEGSSGLFVRGGTPDQNLFLLDDVPLYNVTHLGGFFSVFDPAMVKSMELYKGGFPARYGGRISSVIDVRNKDGNLYEYKGELGLSLLLTKFFIEGPIVKEKSSFAFSVRRSNIDIYTFLNNRMVNNKYNAGYTFYDINGKANYIISPTDRIFVSLYHGRDWFYYIEKDKQVTAGFNYNTHSELKWGNSAASVRWHHVFWGKIFNNLTVASTKYIYQNNNLFESTDLSDQSKLTDEFNLSSSVTDLFIKTDLEIPINKSILRVGGKVSKYFFLPSSIYHSQSLGDSTLNSPRNEFTIDAHEESVYGEYIFSGIKNLSVNLGLRIGNYFVTHTSFFSIEPRMVANYEFLATWSLKASYCKMQQNMHLLTNSNMGLPTDLWLPSTDVIAPETSQQVTIGLAHTTASNIEFSVEAYHKKLNNLIEYKEGVLLYGTNETWDEKIEKEGTGKVNGLEFLIRKNEGRITGWIGYTLSKNDRSFANIDNGTYYPFKYDQRHDFSLVVNYQISQKLSFSGTWVYHTGHAVTMPVGKYQLINTQYASDNADRTTMSDVHIYSKKNGYRMPAYHRLDVGLNYTKKKRKGEAIWTLGIYNLYNRQNAYYLFFKKKDGVTKLYQQSLFPFMANFGYTYLF